MPAHMAATVLAMLMSRQGEEEAVQAQLQADREAQRRPAQLSHNEIAIYRELVQAAREGRPCPNADQLNEVIDCSSASTSTTIMSRLERYGLIRVDRYQRSRQVHIVATGESTAEPASKVPHWRDRPREVPTPAISVLKQRGPDVMAQIAAWASRRGVPVVDALADLVWVGWEVEQGRG